MNVNDFVETVIRRVLTTKLIDAALLVDLGVKDINTYRTDISATLVKHLTDVKDQVIFFQLMMAQANRKRLLAAVKQNPDLIKNYPKVLTFIEKNTCAATKDHKIDSICTLKVASSFPDICAVIFVVSQLKLSKPDIHIQLIQQLWSGSLDYADDAQAMNKTAVMIEWNKWGKQNPNKKNTLGEQIKFEEKIYDNAANDKIRLYLPTGVEHEQGKSYTVAMILNYVKVVNLIMSRSTASVTAPKTKTPPPPSPDSIASPKSLKQEDVVEAAGDLGDAQGKAPEAPVGLVSGKELGTDALVEAPKRSVEEAVHEFGGAGELAVDSHSDDGKPAAEDEDNDKEDDGGVDVQQDDDNGEESDKDVLLVRDYDDEGNPLTDFGWYMQFSEMYKDNTYKELVEILEGFKPSTAAMGRGFSTFMSKKIKDTVAMSTPKKG